MCWLPGQLTSHLTLTNTTQPLPLLTHTQCHTYVWVSVYSMHKRSSSSNILPLLLLPFQCFFCLQFRILPLLLLLPFPHAILRAHKQCTPCTPLSLRPQHPLLPLLLLCNTRILFGKILHFALRNWFGQQFSRHLRWVPFWGIDLVIILITMGIFNPTRAGLGFYCIRINNCTGHKCGGRGWDSSIAIIYISFGQQQKATQHCS